MNRIYKLLFILPILPALLVVILAIFIAVIYDFIMNTNNWMENWIRESAGNIFLPYLRWIDNKFKRSKNNASNS